MYPIFPFQEDSRFELSAEAHKDGTEESMTVFDGELVIRVNEDEFLLKSGDSIRFKADRPHIYRNPGNTLTRLSMTIYYPN